MGCLQVADTTGAGDCFTAAFAVALLEGLAPQQALAFACAPYMRCRLLCLACRMECALAPHAAWLGPAASGRTAWPPLGTWLVGLRPRCYMRLMPVLWLCSCRRSCLRAEAWGHAQCAHATRGGGAAAAMRAS